jgi:hypothetical protein
MWFFFPGPFVNSALRLWLLHLLGLPPQQALLLSLGVWGASTAPGLWMDYCTFRVSLPVVAMFATSTLLGSLGGGVLMQRMLGGGW